MKITKQVSACFVITWNLALVAQFLYSKLPSKQDLELVSQEPRLLLTGVRGNLLVTFIPYNIDGHVLTPLHVIKPVGQVSLRYRLR